MEETFNALRGTTNTNFNTDYINNAYNDCIISIAEDYLKHHPSNEHNNIDVFSEFIKDKVIFTVYDTNKISCPFEDDSRKKVWEELKALGCSEVRASFTLKIPV